MANILVFGDSIAYGYYDSDGGWVDRLKRYYIEQEIKNNWIKSINTFNLSIQGDSSKEILNRLSIETPPRYWVLQKPVIIIAVGINDSAITASKLPYTPLKKFEENLNQIFKISKNYSKKILFLGLTPVEQEKVDPMPWNPLLSYTEKSVIQYDKMISDFCNKNKIDFLSLYDNLMVNDLHDGVHPNSQGHEKIFRIVKEFLEKKV